jgi:hypothetical protein
MSGLRKLLALQFLLLSILGSQAHADDPTPEEEKAVVKTVVGQPIRFTLKDGRVGVLKKSVVNGLKRVGIPFQVYENGCNDNVGMTCQLTVSLRKYWYFWVWEKNPDVKKIGQKIKQVSLNDDGSINYESDFDSDYLAIGTEQAFLPKVTAGLAPLELQCADFSWLPGGKKEAPTTLLLDRWDAESMGNNPETGALENRPTGGFFQAKFSRLNPTRMKLDGFGGLTSAFGSGSPIPLGDILLFSIPTGPDSVCQQQMKPASLATAFKQILELETRRPAPEKEKGLYIFGSDELSKEIQADEAVFMSYPASKFRNLSETSVKELQ